MKRRLPVDSWFWELVVKACGGRCCVCFKDGRTLHRGHIYRHEDEGTQILDNLLPVCKSCNSKFKGGATTDGRPDGWQNAFLKLLLVQMNLGIMCKQVPACTGTSLGDKPLESTGLMDLRAVEFVPETHYSTHTDADIPTGPMDPTEARKLVEEAVEKSKDCDIRPRRPTKKRQDAMLRHAQRLGAEGFRIAVEEFLREEPWVLDARKGFEKVHHDSWSHLDDSVDFYLADGLKRRERVAKQAKVDQERDRVQAEETKEHARIVRVAEFLRAAKVPPDWTGMQNSDQVIISTAVAVAKDIADAQAAGVKIPIRDVTESLVDQSRDVVCRYKLYSTGELLAAKAKLRDKLNQCVTWAKRLDIERQKEFGPRIKGLSDWVDCNMDIETLRQESWPIDYLMQELDPDAPSFEDILASGNW